MSDLISRDLVKSLGGECIAARDSKTHELLPILSIDALPSVQSELIRCKDCVHHIDGYFCRQANHHTSDKEHCASVFRAERREE